MPDEHTTAPTKRRTATKRIYGLNQLGLRVLIAAPGQTIPNHIVIDDDHAEPAPKKRAARTQDHAKRGPKE